MPNIKLLRNAKVAGKHYKAGDTVQKVSAKLADELYERGLCEDVPSIKNSKAEAEDKGDSDAMGSDS